MFTASIVANLWLAALSGCGGGGGADGFDASASAFDPFEQLATEGNSWADGTGRVDEGQVNGSAKEPTLVASNSTAASDLKGGLTGGNGGSSNPGGSSGSTGSSTGGASNSATGSGSSDVGSTPSGGAPAAGGDASSPVQPSTPSAPAPAPGAPAPGAPAPGAPAPAPSAPAPAPTALVPLVSGGYASTSAEAARLYGPGVYIMDGLWNIDAKRAGGNDTFPAIRFRAPFSGPVSSIQLYWSDGNGYAAGNGGDIEIRLLPDDGSARHLPNWSATPLATGRRVPGSLSMSNGVYSTGAHRFFPDALSGSGQLVAGAYYHLVGINNASNPSANWSSWDMSYTLQANGRPSRWINPYDFSALYGWRAAGSSAAPQWQDWTVDGHASAYVMPILQVNMANGQKFGNSNMETGNIDSSRTWKNGSSNPVRERFTPTQARTITGLSMQTAKVSGSGGLAWEIRDGSTVLASGVFNQSSANYAVNSSTGNPNGVLTWYDAALATPVQFVPGRTYDVVFTPQGNSVWAFADQRNGSSYGFSAPAAFSESHAQHYSLGMWMDANHWSKLVSSTSGANWRVVLHQAP